MNKLLMNILLTLLLLASYSHGAEVCYQEAYDAYTIGQPMVVLVSAPWCGACQQLKNDLRNSNIQFTVIDIDNPPSAEIKAANYSGGPIPQIVVWRQRDQKTAGIIRRIGNIGVAGVRALLGVR